MPNPLRLLTLATLLAAAPPALAQTACEALAGRSISAAAIGLPSNGATLTSARAVPAGPSPIQGNTALPAHCQVGGRIAPVSAEAPPIIFQVNIPDLWNGKAVQYGGGGFNGVLITGLGQLRDASPDAPHPLERGFATFGTDSGHQNAPGVDIQAFALNDEALENFAHAAYPKVRDVAAEVLRMATGRAPARVYFYGGSEGGREGLTMAQRYPDRYDGVVSAVPVLNWAGLQSFGTRGGQMQREGAWMNPGTVRFLHDATLAACDALDGLADGVISNQPACRRAFNPASLQCRDGQNSSCLTPAQVAFITRHRQPYEYPFPLANGVTAYPGAPLGGEALADGMPVWLTGPEAPRHPPGAAETQARAWYYGGGAVRYFFVRNPDYDPARFDMREHRAQVARISELMDATNPDLSRFVARGGRLIMKQNTADYAQSPGAGDAYWESLRARFGDAALDRFARYYLHHGASHSGPPINLSTGVALPGFLDLLGALDAWVEAGTPPPEPLIQATRDRATTRPLCRYPNYPRFNGGDPNAAASFTCVAP